MSGGDGDDTLAGGDKADRIFGSVGNDTATGGKGDDRLHGGGGNDSLVDLQGLDTLEGGNDDDTLSTQDTFAGDTVKGRGGVNTCMTDASDTVTGCP